MVEVSHCFVARMEDRRRAFKFFLTGKPTEKRPLGRTRRRWDDDIRMDLKEVRIITRNWVDSAQDRNYGIESPGPICHGVS